MAEGWFRRNKAELKTGMRVIFGAVWLIDGWLKFMLPSPSAFVQLVQTAGAGQPAWLMPWFNFWFNVVSQNPAFWVYLIGTGELLLGLGLILGAVRSITYLAGFFLSLLIWAVPEGLGGPYGPGSTDIGTGIIYSFVFLLFMMMNSDKGMGRYSLDGIMEKRFKWWKRLSEAT